MQVLQGNIDLGTSVRKYPANISEASEDAVITTMAEISHDQRVDVILQKLYNSGGD